MLILRPSSSSAKKTGTTYPTIKPFAIYSPAVSLKIQLYNSYMDNFKQVLKFIDKLVDNEHAGKIIEDIDLKVGFSFDFI